MKISISTRASSEAWKLNPSSADPAPAAVDHVAEARDQHHEQQHHGRDQQRPGHLLEVLGAACRTPCAASTQPTRHNTSWRSRNENASPPSLLAIEIDAEVTMMRPEQHDGRAPATSATAIDVQAARARAHVELLHRGGEHVAAMRVVAEHVEARARRRQQHRVAGLRETRRGAAPRPPCVARAHGVADAGERRLDEPGIAAEQHGGAHLAAERRARAARNPGPCRRRRRSAPAGRRVRRPRRAWRRRWCPWNR